MSPVKRMGLGVVLGGSTVSAGSLATFVGVVATGILIVGYVFNAVL